MTAVSVLVKWLLQSKATSTVAPSAPSIYTATVNTNVLCTFNVKHFSFKKKVIILASKHERNQCIDYIRVLRKRKKKQQFWLRNL